MGRTGDLLGGVPKQDLATQDGHILPGPDLPRASRTIGQRRSHFGQRQPILKGLTQRCSSVSRCWNEQAVIFRSFRRSIFVSNVRSLMGSLSLSMSGQQLREDPWLPSIASPRVPPRDIGPHPRLSTLARLRRHTPPPCLMIKSIPWGKSDRAC